MFTLLLKQKKAGFRRENSQTDFKTFFLRNMGEQVIKYFVIVSENHGTHLTIILLSMYSKPDISLGTEAIRTNLRWYLQDSGPVNKSSYKTV